MKLETPTLPPETVLPQAGSSAMPPWDVGELPEPPKFRWSKWYLLLGPGLVMGASAIGGGEWLTGPLVTARYGGALLWLATLSILGQTFYNIEISRYTLYTGEPIFTGKFRTPFGPWFWLIVYLILDFGSILPYLASNAATPLYAVLWGKLPDPALPADANTIKGLACGIFITALIPLVFGGKIYNTLKGIMTFKLVFVVGFLLFLAVFYSTSATWVEIFSGFFRFGTVPVAPVGAMPDSGELGYLATMVAGSAGAIGGVVPDNGGLANVLSGFPVGTALDLSLIGMVASMAAISGNGGLTNTPISNYTRDQGWGMGKLVGAIPSIIGGHSLTLSHQGVVFPVTSESLPRWRGWLNHVQRDQFAVWMPACFIGLALPSMLSVQFLDRGSVPKDQWLAATMTADGVRDAVGGSWGPWFWYLTLFCGFLVLITSLAGTSDGVLRRWVDVFWTASPRLREWEPRQIGKFYFLILCIYTVFGLAMLLFVRGDALLRAIGMIYNFALGFSCWHTLLVNTLLLPKELQPGWGRRLILAVSGLFFLSIGLVSTLNTLKFFDKTW